MTELQLLLPERRHSRQPKIRRLPPSCPEEIAESVSELLPCESTEEKRLTSLDLSYLLKGKRFVLDCGHRCTVGHNLANTMIIVSLGGGRLETYCHSCY